MGGLFSGGHTGGSATRPYEGRFSMVMINWVANPFRGDAFEEAWRPAAELATKYGATAWAFTRSKDDPLSFMQVAVFEKKIDFERYWFAEDTAEARVRCGGLYQVPILPVWWESVGWGVVTNQIEDIEAA
ncbi:MAG: hypothetical protein QOC55_1932 [Thermoleophilaceae bacterium]|jgi:hypothetical protein|nr:hypothetical protein [Thermoleophilaceae bacterium]